MTKDETHKNEDQAKDTKQSGLWVLWSLLLFFLVFASVDAFFVYKALSTHTGVVTENAYEKGLHYNEILDEARRRKEQDGAGSKPSNE